MGRARRRGTNRLAGAALVVVGVLAAAGCGSQPPGTAAGRHHVHSGEAAAPIDGSGSQTVRYHGVEFDVPAGWPVLDLAADPTTCVRYDEHAVYLGSPSDAMQCPATVLGRTDAVLVEPLTTSPVADEAVDATAVNGMDAATDPSAPVENELRTVFPDAGVAVTISFRDQSAANTILASFRSATP
jgi:hypothetical protein